MNFSSSPLFPFPPHPSKQEARPPLRPTPCELPRRTRGEEHIVGTGGFSPFFPPSPSLRPAHLLPPSLGTLGKRNRRGFHTLSLYGHLFSLFPLRPCRHPDKENVQQLAEGRRISSFPFFLPPISFSNGSPNSFFFFFHLGWPGGGEGKERVRCQKQ